MMASHTFSSILVSSIIFSVACRFFMCVSASNFYRQVDVTWGHGRGKILDSGNLLTLSLDRASGSGFQSKHQFLYGKVDIQMKLVSGNSAGTVTTFYMKSPGLRWDEIDFEFLGNLSGHPYTIHTNIYTQGRGDREQQFHLWFDPTANFHTYSILWNPRRIIFLVDETPIREFKNMRPLRVPFPTNQPMRIYSSLWNADEWATRGGLIKTDWSKAPFTASYRSFRVNGCVWSRGRPPCRSNSGNAWFFEELDARRRRRMEWVRRNYMIYNYCTDAKRFPRGFPREGKMA